LFEALMSGGGGSAAATAAPVAADDAGLASPMSGSLVKWLVEDGAAVEVGQPVAVLEAMKMETTVPAHRSGTVARGPHEPGTAVGRGEVLASIG
jgi:acetyl-CoA/propionyl-CoA carboxylase biotin carboxyl carrier protein